MVLNKWFDVKLCVKKDQFISTHDKAVQFSNVDSFQKQGQVLGFISFPPYFNLKIQCEDVYELLLAFLK